MKSIIEELNIFAYMVALLMNLRRYLNIILTTNSSVSKSTSMIGFTSGVSFTATAWI